MSKGDHHVSDALRGANRLVIKIGSSLLTNAADSISPP
jgi:glutamate 5-kinase